jgi:glycosyltransferase involved in cell wall biosynthesis
LSRPVVLAMCDYYLPGYRAGGTVRTLEAMVALLGDELQFRILTRDRDLGSPPYAGIKRGVWEKVGAAEVMYLSPRDLTPPRLRRLIMSTSHDIMYLNSLFSVPFSVYPLALRRLSLITAPSVIIAPRGEVAPGALQLKRPKKAVYIALSRRLGLYERILWQASSQHELEEIRAAMGSRSQVLVASDLSLIRAHQSADGSRLGKEPGSLRVVFLSRISRKKNLYGALAIISGIRGRVELTIHGPIEDEQYWRECQSSISQLPRNITVRYAGVVSPDQVPDAIASHHLMFLPTLGENYGHAILEALSVGRPVLISDRTPWRRLESLGVGWDVSLDQPGEFQRILDQCVAMDSVRWRELSEAAAAYAARTRRDPEAQQRNRALFHSCLDRSQTTPGVERVNGTHRSQD